MGELGVNRCNIVAETLHYIYIETFGEQSVSVMSLYKDDGTISTLGDVYDGDGEYYESLATSNYDADMVNMCYALNDGTYAVTVDGVEMSLKKISETSYNDVVAMIGTEEKYLAIYDTATVPYTYRPTVIYKDSDEYKEKEIQLKPGALFFLL